MRLEDLPGRVFLDTSVVNFILDFGEQIHENAAIPADKPVRVRQDIEALRNIFTVGSRAQWQLAISPYTYHEVSQTSDPQRLRQLETWFGELWQYWRDTIDENDDLSSLIEAEHARLHMLVSGVLNALPDLADRVLISDAVVYRCELFCTRDWTTILRHRSALATLPLEIVSPVEWWEQIRPYAGLFV